ncbi:class I SAM-dependent methyltransferase [Microvirga sp. M2]|uniref:class I SAM-dependent methyltransferase n=1 Tax=Microvirga sp. M2 TaxID=3073270 RepID=UPI0039C276A5
MSTLFSAPYSDPRLRSLLLSHYRTQGTVSFDLLEGVDYTIQECSECSLIFQKMAPINEMLAVLYDQFIDPKRLKELELSRLTLENFREIGRRLSDLFETIGKQPRDIRMLDFGFGYGRWARVAVAMGAEVFATEISPDKIAFAQSIGVKIITQSELPSFRFDVVHTEQVFEHLADPRGVFAELAACLAEGGVFKMAMPKQGRIRKLLRKHGMIDWSPYEEGYKRREYTDYSTIIPLEHVNSFSLKAVAALARGEGLRAEVGRFGSRHLDIDLGSFRAAAKSSRDWGMRLLKDIYVTVGPGKQDSGYYMLYRE